MFPVYDCLTNFKMRK